MIVKRKDLASLKAVIAAAEADKGYVGNTTVDGTESGTGINGTPESCLIEFVDES